MLRPEHPFSYLYMAGKHGGINSILVYEGPNHTDAAATAQGVGEADLGSLCTGYDVQIRKLRCLCLWLCIPVWVLKYSFPFAPESRRCIILSMAIAKLAQTMIE